MDEGLGNYFSDMLGQMTPEQWAAMSNPGVPWQGGENIVTGAAKMAMAPGQALQSTPENPITTGEMIKPAGDLAMAMVGTPGGAGGLGSGVRAYHGSPYDFERFDLSKVGTGEGNQVYGHGLYFAENPAVAADYKKMLSGPFGRGVNDELMQSASGGLPLTPEHMGVLRHFAGDTNLTALDAAKRMQWRFPELRDEGLAGSGENARGLMAATEQVRNAARGHMYEVDINADPQQFLNWDKPLREQSPSLQDAVMPHLEAGRVQQQSAIDALLKRGTDAFGKPLKPERISSLQRPLTPLSDAPGSEIYKRMGLPANTQSEAALIATDRLNKAGVPGISYLDQGSRIAGDAAKIIQNYGSPQKALAVAQERLKTAPMGDLAYWDGVVKQLQKPQSSNYVVFNDKLIDILKKYLIPLGVGGGAVGAMQQNQPYPALTDHLEGAM